MTNPISCVHNGNKTTVLFAFWDFIFICTIQVDELDNKYIV